MSLHLKYQIFDLKINCICNLDISTHFPFFLKVQKQSVKIIHFHKKTFLLFFKRAFSCDYIIFSASTELNSNKSHVITEEARKNFYFFIICVVKIQKYVLTNRNKSLKSPFVTLTEKYPPI